MHSLCVRKRALELAKHRSINIYLIKKKGSLSCRFLLEKQKALMLWLTVFDDTLHQHIRIRNT